MEPTRQRDRTITPSSPNTPSTLLPDRVQMHAPVLDSYPDRPHWHRETQLPLPIERPAIHPPIDQSSCQLHNSLPYFTPRQRANYPLHKRASRPCVPLPKYAKTVSVPAIELLTQTPPDNQNPHTTPKTGPDRPAHTASQN